MTSVGSVLNNGASVKRCVLKPRSQGRFTGLQWTNAGERVGPPGWVEWFARIGVARMALRDTLSLPGHIPDEMVIIVEPAISTQLADV